jgi:plastocyanin
MRTTLTLLGTVRLERGERYQIWCAPHEDIGMRATFVAR